MPYLDGGFGLLHIAWIVLVLLVWVGIVALIVLGLRWLLRSAPGDSGSGGARPPAASARPDDALEILRQRYARGEIDDEEFERRRRTLGG